MKAIMEIEIHQNVFRRRSNDIKLTNRCRRMCPANLILPSTNSAIELPRVVRNLTGQNTNELYTNI